jgi:hypothetical protein
MRTAADTLRDEYVDDLAAGYRSDGQLSTVLDEEGLGLVE